MKPDILGERLKYGLLNAKGVQLDSRRSQEQGRVFLSDGEIYIQHRICNPQFSNRTGTLADLVAQEIYLLFEMPDIPGVEN